MMAASIGIVSFVIVNVVEYLFLRGYGRSQ
jgi:hypothetical protein